MFQETTIILIIGFLIIFLAFIAGVLLFVRQAKKNHLTFLKEKDFMSQQHHKELLQTQLEIQSQTMQHIGREIHDNVGQQLTLASLYTQQLGHENKAPLVKDKIDIISQIINQSLADLRSLSKSLTDDHITDHTLLQLMQLEADKINRLNICKVNLSAPFNLRPISYQARSILLRVVQEFIQNSIKHGKCSSVDIVCTQEANSLRLSLADDGVGFNTAKENTAGIGLSNMKKRVELLHGNFDIHSDPGAGTRVVISIPFINLSNQQ